MNRREFVASTAAAALTAAASPALARSGAQMSPTPPVAKKIPVTITQLGRTRTDD